MNLDELKVKSFVTNVEKERELTVKGGMPPGDPPIPSKVCPLPTINIRLCTWYSELYTACGCETEAFLCGPLSEER